MKHVLLAAIALCLIPSTAFAQAPAPQPSPAAPAQSVSPASQPPGPPRPTQDPDEHEGDDDRGHVVSVTFSPLHLIFPEVRLMGEIKVNPKMSVAALAGYGSIGVDTSGTPNVTVDRVTVWEAGGQFRYYPIGTFEHGMEVGAHVEYIGASASGSSCDGKVFGAGSGVLMGPFVGYKLATRVGFTLDLQGGVGYEVITASASGTNGNTATASSNTFAPIVNLHMGWSF
jgi:hypothetical protein